MPCETAGAATGALVVLDTRPVALATLVAGIAAATACTGGSVASGAGAVVVVVEEAGGAVVVVVTGSGAAVVVVVVVVVVVSGVDPLRMKITVTQICPSASLTPTPA